MDVGRCNSRGCVCDRNDKVMDNSAMEVNVARLEGGVMEINHTCRNASSNAYEYHGTVVVVWCVNYSWQLLPSPRHNSIIALGLDTINLLYCSQYILIRAVLYSSTLSIR